MPDPFRKIVDLVPRVRERDGTAYDELSEFHRKFVDFYIGIADGNPKKAARLAGWKLCTRTEALMVYTQIGVQRALREVLRSQVMSPEQILERVTRLASANIKNLCDEDGNLLPLKEIDADDAFIIREYTVTPTQYGPKVHIKIHNPETALIKLGQRWGVLTDQLEIDPAQLQDAISRGLEELAARQATGDAATVGGPTREDVIEAEYSYTEDDPFGP